MEENDSLNLDLEFKRYLQILRPYLGQLTNEKVITICKSWIKRLSECTENEKTLRNKYVFSLCYQLAKGLLEEPFLNPPPSKLVPVPESVNSDDSSTEIECVVVDAGIKMLYNNQQGKKSDIDYLSQDNEFGKAESVCDSDMKSSFGKSNSSCKQTVLSYTCPKVLKDYSNYDDSGNVYEHRAKNLVKKLREIKAENMMLHTELLSLKEESTANHFNPNNTHVIKADNATNSLISAKNNESSATLKSLKFRLQEVQESRNTLINKVVCLQEQLDNFNEARKHDIEEIEAKYKLEIINIKTTVRDEIKDTYEKKIEGLKMTYDLKIKEINKSLNDVQGLKLSKDDEIEEKNTCIASKDSEISRLKCQIDELKNNLHSVLEKFIDKPVDNFSGDNMRFKTQQLEKRLNKMEKNKIRSTRVYEAKMAQLQRDKHLAKCSLQLQMVKQRAQIVNEVTDENQTELTSALDKLEAKYKEIVANVQTTAIQRRIQDQATLESILQAACGIPHENLPQGTNQFSKTMRNQNQSCDSEISPLLHCNKGNKSFGEDSLGAGYCLNGERMVELFERVYVPQRDNSEGLK